MRDAKVTVVGICGMLRAGKSTFAEALVRRAEDRGIPVKLFPFAQPLKDIATNQFGWDGQKDERGRRLLQVLGTDAGRTYNPNIWVDKWVESVSDWARLRERPSLVLADDVRFDNEARTISRLPQVVTTEPVAEGCQYVRGSFVVKILRADHNPGMTDHASEAGVSDDLVDLTYSFKGGAIDEIRDAAWGLMDRIFG